MSIKYIFRSMGIYLSFFLFSMLLVYITGVFNTGDFNIQHWNRECRNANTMIVWVIFSIISFIYKINKEGYYHERNLY